MYSFLKTRKKAKNLKQAFYRWPRWEKRARIAKEVSDDGRPVLDPALLARKVYVNDTDYARGFFFLLPAKPIPVLAGNRHNYLTVEQAPWYYCKKAGWRDMT